MRGNLKMLATGLVAALAIAGAARGDAVAATPSLPTYATRHYTLHTDVPADLARDLSDRLDAMFDEYARRLSPFGPERVPRQDVWVFARRDDYADFVGDRLPNTGGVFIPSRGVLAAFLEGQGRDALRRTLQHEAFHQFADVVISSDLPAWINEGLAQVFEESIYTGRPPAPGASAFVVEQVPQRRIRQLLADIKARRLVPFERFVALDHDAWASAMRDRDRGTTQYNQAWAMVYFLVYSFDPTRAIYPYRDRFFRMLLQIKSGVPSGDAFVANFGNNFDGFQKRFDEYAQTLRPTRESTYLENTEVLGDMMAELLNTEHRRFGTLADFRRHLERGGYQLNYSKGALKWTTDSNVAVYFRDAQGRELSPGQASLSANPGAPLPDLILRPPGSLEYRARFFTADDGKADHEIVVRAY